MRYYYWPRVFHDVAEHCTCCEACKKSARRRASEKGKLVPMPIVGVPFRKVAIDMVGPLPRTKRGKQVCASLSRLCNQVSRGSGSADSGGCQGC